MKKLLVMASVTVSVALQMTVSSCSSSDIDDSNVVYNKEGKAGVKPEFVISIPRTVVGGTRQGNDVTQNAGTVAQFRGLDNIRMIPFNAVPTGSSTKLADIMRLSNIQALASPGAINYKVYADQFVPIGTKNFLFYAKAIDYAPEVDITSMNDKFKYGVLHATGLTESEFSTVNDITFGYEQINTSTESQTGNTVGRNIVQLLTNLANTTVSGVGAGYSTWSTTTEPNLKALYTNFIGITVASSKSLSFILSKLYFSLDRIQSSNPGSALATALKAKITAACSAPLVSGDPAQLRSDYAGYPANIGLPDGAARVRWNSSGLNPNTFIDITANYNMGNKVDITDYVYPAALWYHVSSPIKAATAIKSPDYPKAGNWDGVISSVYNGAGDEVKDDTRSVALTQPAQYGVGRVETKITMGSGTFYDGNGEVVEIGDGFTLKGFLLGGQNSAAYDFTALGNENYTIYDRNMASGSIIASPGTTTATGNQTLALETKSNQPVYAALELVNGGEDFMGFDGIIPAGGTFYLTTKLDPTTAANYALGTMDKIVMQDHVTKLTVTIKNGGTTPDRNGDGNPDVYIKDGDGKPIGVDTNGDGTPDPYDIDGDGTDDTFITDPAHGGPGWDTDGDGEVDIPVLPNPMDGKYPDQPNVPEGLGKATNGIPDLRSPGVELGTSVNIEWQEGLILNPSI